MGKMQSKLLLLMALYHIPPNGFEKKKRLRTMDLLAETEAWILIANITW